MVLCRIQIFLDNWTEVLRSSLAVGPKLLSIPCHIKPLHCTPNDMAPGFLPANKQRGSTRWRPQSFYNLKSYMPSFLPYCIIRGKLLCLAHTHKFLIIDMCEYQEVRIVVDHFRGWLPHLPNRFVVLVELIYVKGLITMPGIQ